MLSKNGKLILSTFKDMVNLCKKTTLSHFNLQKVKKWDLINFQRDCRPLHTFDWYWFQFLNSFYSYVMIGIFSALGVIFATRRLSSASTLPNCPLSWCQMEAISLPFQSGFKKQCGNAISMCWVDTTLKNTKQKKQKLLPSESTSQRLSWTLRIWLQLFPLYSFEMFIIIIYKTI